MAEDPFSEKHSDREPDDIDSRDRPEVSRDADRPAGDAFAGFGGPWVGGVALILVGVLFLLQNFTGLDLGNWWALLILIPALMLLARTWTIYNQNGRLTAPARGPLVGGLLLVVVASIFLFDLEWGTFWPAILIALGIGLLLTSTLGGGETPAAK